MEKRLHEAKEEVCNWRKKHDDLEKEREALLDEIMSEVLASRNYELEQSKELENDQLVKYIEKRATKTWGFFLEELEYPN